MWFAADPLILAVEDPTPTATVVRVAGDLSRATAPRLARLVDTVLDRCVETGRSHVIVDLSCVRSFGHGGLHVLRHAQLAGADTGLIVHLTGIADRAELLPAWVPPLVARFDSFPTLEDAVDALARIEPDKIGYSDGMANNVTDSVDVAVPVSTAYNQWTQFESFPKFMDGVERIDQITETRTHWVTKIAGVTREFDAEITEQHPDERVAWTTENGTHQAGVVTFHRLDDATTRVTLQLDHDPEGFVEKAGDALGIIGHRVKGDLKNFKSFIESRGHEEGAWRDDVARPPQIGDTA